MYLSVLVQAEKALQVCQQLNAKMEEKCERLKAEMKEECVALKSAHSDTLRSKQSQALAWEEEKLTLTSSNEKLTLTNEKQAKHVSFLGGELQSLAEHKRMLSNDLTSMTKRGVREARRFEKDLDAAHTDLDEARTASDHLVKTVTDANKKLGKENKKLEQKLSDLRGTRQNLYDQRGHRNNRIKQLEKKLILKTAQDAGSEPPQPLSRQKRIRVDLPKDRPQLIPFRDPKSKRVDGRSRFTAEAHHATSTINQAAGFISNRYAEMQEKAGESLFIGGDKQTIDTHRGGSVYRCDEVADVMRLLKEMELFADKAVCLSVDLSPLKRKEIGNCDIAFTLFDKEGKKEHKQILLPLIWVRGKDGKSVSDAVDKMFKAIGLKCEQVYVLTTDGGSENNGGDLETGLGMKGILARLFPTAIWIWCGGHVAQICYKKSMKAVPLGFLKGLKEVVAFLRLGQNHSKILAHACRLAGEKNSEFQESILHAQAADELEWKAEIRSKRSHKGDNFDHRIAQPLSEIRFASAIPGNNIVISYGALLPMCIRLEWGGNSANNIKVNGAFKAYGILTDDEWSCWSHVLKVTFTCVVQVMFKDIMQNSGFNVPALACGGMWQRWVTAGHNLLQNDTLHPAIFSRAISKAKSASRSKGTCYDTTISLAVQHVKDLTSSIGVRFGSIYNRPEMSLPGMLAEDYSSARQAAQELCTLWSSDRNECHPAIIRVMSKHAIAVKAFANGSLMDSGLHTSLCDYDQRCHSLRVESTFSILTYLAKKASHIGLQRLSLVARAKANDTVLELKDWQCNLATARKMNRPGSPFKALFKAPLFEEVWQQKYGHMKPLADAGVTTTEQYEVFAAAERDAKCQEKVKKRKANPRLGLKLGYDDSKCFVRSDEAERMADHGIDCDDHELEYASLELDSEAGTQLQIDEGGVDDAPPGATAEDAEQEAEMADTISLHTLEMCGLEGCGEEQPLSDMKRFAGIMMCRSCARAGQRMSNGGEYTSDDDSVDADNSETEPESDDDDSDTESESGDVAANGGDITEPSEAEHVPLPTSGMCASWFINADEGYADGKQGTIVVSTEGAGTYKDFDKKRAARLSKECITVTKYGCIEIGFPSGWEYVAVGDFVELDVVTDGGGRGLQIAEVTSLFETNDEHYKFEYSWMYNHDQIQAELPWYEIPADFNEQLELVSGQRLHLEDIEAIVSKVKVLDKYKQASVKCAKLKSKYYRKVVDELMKRWS